MASTTAGAIASEESVKRDFCRRELKIADEMRALRGLQFKKIRCARDAFDGLIRMTLEIFFLRFPFRGRKLETELYRGSGPLSDPIAASRSRPPAPRLHGERMGPFRRSINLKNIKRKILDVNVYSS